MEDEGMSFLLQIRSKTSSVRFDDEVEAHSEDSTESRFGSRENLLETPPSPTQPEARYDGDYCGRRGRL